MLILCVEGMGCVLREWVICVRRGNVIVCVMLILCVMLMMCDVCDVCVVCGLYVSLTSSQRAADDLFDLER